ncbi:MAG TPA: hypothetical protein ENI55_01515 [Alphaproteobacteria bacterium]|nr:hypothetical protein [Alphaproteobacteria bacterium]
MTRNPAPNPTLALADGTFPAATGQAVCAGEIPAAAPEEIQLLPLGEIRARDGRKWRLTDAASVVRASLPTQPNGGIDLVIDYNHQTDLVDKTGHAAPAAGWIKKLMVRADGIWAAVEWTAKAKEHLRNREYRYISPTFLFDKKTGVITRILRAALTNSPALQLKALASQKNEETMEDFIKALAALLGLAEDADREKALAAVKNLVEQSAASGETLLAVCKTLDLDEDAGGGDIAKALDSAKALAAKTGNGEIDTTKYVAVEKFDALAKDFAGLEADRAAEKATAAVDQAVKDGKVTPHLKDWALDYASRDLAGFADYIAGAPVVTSSGRVISGVPKGGGSGLDEDEKAVCAALGLSEEDFKKTREQDQQENAA